MTAFLALVTGLTALIGAIIVLYKLLDSVGFIRHSEPEQPQRRHKEPDKTHEHDYPAEDD